MPRKKIPETGDFMVPKTEPLVTKQTLQRKGMKVKPGEEPKGDNMKQLIAQTRAAAFHVAQPSVVSVADPQKLVKLDLPAEEVFTPGSSGNPEGRRLVGAYGVKIEGAPISPMQISRRELLDDDVELDIVYCSICKSDDHHVHNEWKDSIFPMCPGHEIVSIVTDMGRNVTEFKIGDKVCVGNLVNSCRQCSSCIDGNEQYCINGVSWSYNGQERFPGELLPTGELTFGGYSSMIVVNKDFVLKLPDNLPMAASAPLLCAGITVFNPLIQHEIGPGKVVGVAGIGGLGHLAVKMAHKMGATVIAITRTPWKVSDVFNLGADGVLLATDQHQMKKAQATMDLIIDTIPYPHPMDIYLNLLKVGGKHHILGTLEPIPSLNAKLLTNYNRSITASNVGGIPLTKYMLQWCADNQVYADYEFTPIEKIQECFDRMRVSDVRYRFVIDIKKQHVKEYPRR